MAEPTSKVPVKSETSRTSVPEIWRPFESLRREVDRLFEGFGNGFWRSPFRSLDIAPFRGIESSLSAVPAVDVSETFAVTHNAALKRTAFPPCCSE